MIFYPKTEITNSSFLHCVVCLTADDTGHPQWMEYGMNGPAGAPALPPALMGPCREPGSVMAPHMEAPSAEESGWKLSTASLGSAQVRILQYHMGKKIFVIFV